MEGKGNKDIRFGSSKDQIAERNGKADRPSKEGFSDSPREIVRTLSEGYSPEDSDYSPSGGRPRGTVVYAAEVSSPEFRNSTGDMKLKGDNKRAERLATLRKLSTSCPAFPPMVLNLRDSGSTSSGRRGNFLKWNSYFRKLGKKDLHQKSV